MKRSERAGSVLVAKAIRASAELDALRANRCRALFRTYILACLNTRGMTGWSTPSRLNQRFVSCAGYFRHIQPPQEE